MMTLAAVTSSDWILTVQHQGKHSPVIVAARREVSRKKHGRTVTLLAKDLAEGALMSAFPDLDPSGDASSGIPTRSLGHESGRCKKCLEKADRDVLKESPPDIERIATEQTDRAILRPVHLADRQLEAARLLVKGLSNKEIGAQMGIGERGAKSHLAAIARKAKVRGRVQIALWLEREYFPKA